jgi:uncharacterized protein YceH (UPF0502 family)
MLRGPQTIGEIRTRGKSLRDFSSLEEVEITLSGLMSGNTPLVVRLSRQPGQKEVRYAHLLSGEVAMAPAAPLAAVLAPGGQLERLAKLEQDVDELKRQFEEFRRQLE